jgi:predicted cupin superfamily sugar epimerase
MSVTNQLIKKYNLEPHPEGGWYKQTYKCNEQIVADALPDRFKANRGFFNCYLFFIRERKFFSFSSYQKR